MFKKTAILLAAMALGVVGAQAGTTYPGCGFVSYGASSGTIGDFDAIIQGDKCFSDFSVDIDATVNVVSFVDPDGTIGLRFNSSAFEIIGQNVSLDITLQYKVTVLDPDFFIVAIGQSMTPGGFGSGSSVNIDEAAWSAGFGSGGLLANSTISWLAPTNDPCDGITDAACAEEPGDDLVLSTPSQMVWVTKDISLVAGCGGYDSSQVCNADARASATTIFQRFYQEDGGDANVPEPATMLLFSTALLGLGLLRRKKS